MKILITGGNNAKALKLLKAFPQHFVLLADYGEVPAITTAQYSFKSLGNLNQDSIAHILLNFAITESIDCIIPLHHYEVEPMAKSSVLFGEYNIDILVPQSDSLDRYFSANGSTHSNFAIFVRGECIFASGGEIFVAGDETLHGVFGYNSPDDSLTMFTI